MIWPFKKSKSNFVRGQELAMKYCAMGRQDELLELIDTSREFGEYDDFDRGCEEYIKRFNDGHSSGSREVQEKARKS